MTAHEHTTELISSPRGTKLALHHFGGSGPPLMICHATGFHARCYLPMLPELTAEFEVWGVDFAGHGASPAPADGDFAWTGYADDLLTAIDHIGVPAVRAFGHSMGGATALLAEKRRSGVIEAAWLFEPIIVPEATPPKNSMMSAAASKRRREFDSRGAALLRYAGRPPLGIMRADALAAYVEYGFHDTEQGTVTLACAPETEAATFDGAKTTAADIHGLTPRTMIAFGGAENDPGPADFAGPAAAALANAELRNYEQLTHFGPMEDPTRIAKDVAEFLR